MLRTVFSLAICVVLSTLSAVPPASAADWPPVDPTHTQLTSDSLEGVPAVVLFRKARLRFRDYPVEANSQLDVQIRIKILTEEGTDYGSVEVEHSRWVRLDDFEGRTVAADGREVPLSKDQVFEERRSRRGKEFVTKAAFPAVEPGAIVDYRYTLYWDNLFFLEPWYFQLGVPVLLSEIVYFLPDRYAAQPWGIQTTTRKMESELTNVPKGKELRLWIENAPKIPDEPYAPPNEVLSSRFMMVPKSINLSGDTFFLMDRWESVGELFEDNYYVDFRRKDGDAKKLAKQLTRGLGSAREKAEAVYRHVRDEVRYASGFGVWPTNTNANQTLDEGIATAAETGLLLQIMLKAAGIDSDLVWAAHRDQGLVDLSVANPSWFDGVFVRVDFGQGPIYLDATDPGLAFGQLQPGFEGMAAVVPELRKPEMLELPKSDPAASERTAKLKLAVDEGGRMAGSGWMERTGQWAWALIDGSDDHQAKIDAWKESLEKDYPTFEVTGIEVSEDADTSRVEIRWSMAQRVEEVLGDEVSIAPAAVLAASQAFEAEKRLTPVQLEMNRNDVVELELSWPPGWEIEAVPEMVDFGTPLGKYKLDMTWDEEAGTLSYRREFGRPAGEIRGGAHYGVLRQLYDVAARTDASTISLYLP